MGGVRMEGNHEARHFKVVIGFGDFMFATRFINLVDSIGELVRGGGSFAYGTTVLMIVISFIFQLAGNWRLTGRDF